MIRGLTYKANILNIKTIDGEVVRFEPCEFMISDDVLTVMIKKESYGFPLRNVIRYFWEAL